jgi:hypothetical protein
MSAGTYEESLPCGGKLKVTRTSWEIVYYFPGPDLRYKGTFVSVPGATIEQYIVALGENWKEYEQLTATIPKGGEFSKAGRMGMAIRVGGFAKGVCLRDHYMPIASTNHLEQVVGGYRYAARRAPQILQFLAAL